ncbi:uncharacterized protein LY89DRAFT_733876 [Mollisia scopiformis]|uniref:Uncharacterized protein n=1 Tax=Mollisia scopiformis TaxID=149040 RepID=A0A194XAT2_MOLSC|nr:uncharacterized protein LY89DRAFT_733876 [Mollisia scopiformis]KUJ16872.1 hypothetical protein LY89DRAFT_733876 [Mollisia scopiformis]
MANSDKAIGRDVPWEGKSKFRSNQECTILTSQADELNVYTGKKYRFDFFSQNPTILLPETLLEGKTAFVNYICLDSEHMKKISNSVKETVQTTSLDSRPEQPIDLSTINTTLATMHVPPMSAEDHILLMKQHKRGIDIMSFGTEVNSEAVLTIFSDKFGTLPEDSQLRQILADLRKGCRVTIIRDHSNVWCNVGDKTWLHRLQKVFTHGLYPDFLSFQEEQVHDEKSSDPNATKPKQRLQCYLDGDLLIPNLPWMKLPPSRTDVVLDYEGEPVPLSDRYGTFSIRRRFTSLQDYQIFMALLALKDHHYQEEMLNKIFNRRIKHTARVSKMLGVMGYYLYISVDNLVNTTMPKISDDTTFDITEAIGPKENEDDKDLEPFAFSARVTDKVWNSRSCFVLAYFPDVDPDW